MAGGGEAALNYLAAGLAKSYDDRLNEEKLLRAEGRAAQRDEEKRKLDFLNSGEYPTELFDKDGNVIARRDLSSFERQKMESEQSTYRSTRAKNDEDEKAATTGLARRKAHEASGSSLSYENAEEIAGAVAKESALLPLALKKREAENSIDSKYGKGGSGGSGDYKPLKASPKLKSFILGIANAKDGGNILGATGKGSELSAIASNFFKPGTTYRQIANAALAGNETAIAAMDKMMTATGGKDTSEDWNNIVVGPTPPVK